MLTAMLHFFFSPYFLRKPSIVYNKYRRLLVLMDNLKKISLTLWRLLLTLGRGPCLTFLPCWKSIEGFTTSSCSLVFSLVSCKQVMFCKRNRVDCSGRIQNKPTFRKNKKTIKFIEFLSFLKIKRTCWCNDMLGITFSGWL